MYIIILQVGAATLALFLIVLLFYKPGTSQHAVGKRVDQTEACLAAAMNAGASNCHVWNNRLAATDGDQGNLLLIDYNQYPVQEYFLHLSTIEHVSLNEIREPGNNYIERTELHLKVNDGSSIIFPVFDSAFDAFTDLPRLARFSTYFTKFLERLVSEHKALTCQPVPRPGEMQVAVMAG